MSTTTPPPAGPGGPEYLEQGGGEPIGPSGDGPGGRRTALIAGGAIVGLLAVGGGVWAAMSFFATGPQPSEMLPDSTLGYASVDLDPSGGQKIEAFRMIEKFPAIKKELDGLDADDDLLEKVFSELEDECEGLSYADDVKPWLGYRFAVAAVDLGEEMPTPVGVVQVKDAGAAEDGLAALRDCGGDSGVGGWVIDGDWAVIAETDELAEQVVDATSDGTLADDETFQKWNGELGDAGVVNVYASPDAGQHLSRMMNSFPMGMSPMALGSRMDAMAEPEVPEEMSKALEDFEGMAATLRFDDGALELEVVGDAGDDAMANLATDAGDDVVSTLPEDTAVAIGFGVPEGWLDSTLEQAAAMSDTTPEELAAEFEAMTGVTVDDIETLLGDSAALALSSDIDMDALFSSSDGSEVPVGAKIQGDAAAIEDVVARITAALGGPPELFGTDADGDMVAIGPNADYRATLLEDGGLGDTDAFQNVVREAEQASAIAFVNFDAGDWLTGLAEGDPEAEENLEPLEGLGLSTWTTDEGAHGVFRLTTN